MVGLMLRFLNITNCLFGIAIIALLAGITSERLASRLGNPLSGKAGKDGKGDVALAPVASRIEDLSYYAPILTSGLFGRMAQGQLTPITNTNFTAESAATLTAPAELMLLGTAVGSFRETFALIRHTTKQEERVFRLGEMVFDAGRLTDVGREKAFIVINNRKVELLTPMTPPAAVSNQSPPVAMNIPVAVARQGAGSYIIDQRALNAALDNPAQAMSDARLLPSQKDGKVEGFRASEVKPNGVFSMIGIKNGDVILRLNDLPMDSPDKALQSFVALKGQTRLKLDLVRDGQPATFNYDIR